MRVLVTGATGYLGRAIVAALASRGHTPVAFARTIRHGDLPGEAVAGDVRDRAALRAAAARADALIHSAALVSQWRPDPREFDDVNVGGLEYALAASREAGHGRIVYTSSFLALPPAGASAPIAANDYQRTKVAARAVAERARASGAPVVILYPGVVYGPGRMSEGNLVGRLLTDHARGRLPGLVGADRVWSFAWVDEVAAAHVAALGPAPEPAYELGGDNAPPRRVFEIARDLTGDAVPWRLPYWLADVAGRVEEWRARLTGAPPLVTRGAVEIFRHDWPLRHDLAGRDLGYRPRSLDEGVRELLGRG
jgi:farnesol dehydrogenase